MDISSGRSERGKPTVYIASPYTKGDVALNVRFQCEVFDRLLSEGHVLPVAPLWSHFQHTMFPRSYQEWINYDLSMLPLYDCCLRLDAIFPELGYRQGQSFGADQEVDCFTRLRKPVFYSIDALYAWVESVWKQPMSAG